MESIDKTKPYQFSLSKQEDLYNIVNIKTKEFLESVHHKSITERFFFKKDDFKALIGDVPKGDIFKNVVYYPNYANVSHLSCKYHRKASKLLMMKTLLLSLILRRIEYLLNSMKIYLISLIF